MDLNTDLDRIEYIENDFIGGDNDEYCADLFAVHVSDDEEAFYYQPKKTEEERYINSVTNERIWVERLFTGETNAQEIKKIIWRESRYYNNQRRSRLQEARQEQPVEREEPRT